MLVTWVVRRLMAKVAAKVVPAAWAMPLISLTEKVAKVVLVVLAIREASLLQSPNKRKHV